MKKIIMLSLALVLIVSMFAGCKKATDAAATNGEAVSGEDQLKNVVDGLSSYKDEVIFKVNDVEIMKSQANFFLYQIKNYYESYYGPTVWEQEAEPGVTVAEFVKGDIKDISVRMAILAEVATEKGFALTQEKKDELLTQATAIYEGYTPEIIEKYGFTLELVQNILLSQGVTEVVFEEMMKDYEVDQTRLAQDMAANQQVRARHILIKTIDDANQPLSTEAIDAARTKIEGLLERAKNGEDFAALATEFTEDAGSAATGGEYTFGHNEMVPEFEAAAYGLEIGGISDIVETTYGFHIIKLEEKIDPLPEEYIYMQKLEAFDVVYQEMLAGYTIEVTEELWNSLTFVDASEVIDAPALEMELPLETEVPVSN